MYLYHPVDSLTLEDLHIYHSVEREVFRRLVSDHINQEPAAAMLIMALWLWFEENPIQRVISRVVNLAPFLLKVLASEALTCLRCLGPTEPPSSENSIHLHKKLLSGEPVSLSSLHRNKHTTISGVRKHLKNVCAWAFADIIRDKLAQRFPHLNFKRNKRLPIPGFPHPIFGDVEVIARPLNFPLTIERLCNWPQYYDVPADERTLFLTFSRGHPVLKEEIEMLFTNFFGDCIESIEMQIVPPEKQPLNALLVLQTVNTVDRILAGRPLAKFRVSGKHVWARKYKLVL